MTADIPRPHAALLLTPGAGAGREQSSLVAIEDALEPRRFVVERMDFPYRLAGRRSPDKPAVLLGAVREGATRLAAAAGLPPERVALGGRSMGGRICSMVAADGLACLGLVLVSYPLHPPGRADQLRVEHFPKLRVPCVFVSGTRDVFGTPAELEHHASAIPGPVSHVWIEGGDHGLRGRDAEVADAVAAWLTGLCQPEPPITPEWAEATEAGERPRD